MRRVVSGALLAAALLSCGAESTRPHTFTLRFQGDGSFGGPHGDHAVTAAVVRTGDQVVIATAAGIVSATAAPTFSFSFHGLAGGASYEVHYWIDSNFGGGVADVCDPPLNDHQWRAEVPAPTSAELTQTELHDAADVTDVCPTFD